MQQNFRRFLLLMASMILGEAFYAKVKTLHQTFSWRPCPQTPFLENGTTTKDITLLANRADKWSLLKPASNTFASMTHLDFQSEAEVQ